jgi:hypothetical protein
MNNNLQTPINPQGFTNQQNISGMFGQAVDNTFTRNVGAEQSQIPTDPLTGLKIDPTMSQDPNAPLPPPMGVQTPTTPIYDINNY